MNFLPANKLLSQHRDKVLFAVASVYFVGAVVWLVSRDRLPFLGVSQASIPETESSSSPAQTQFIAYLQRSLATIDRQAALKQSATTPSSKPVAMQAPSTPNPPQNTPQIIERVYIPIYPQNQSANSANPIPNSPLPPPPLNLAPPTPLETPQLSTVPVLTPEAAPLPQVAPQVAAAPSGSTLVGLLESGDRSAALVNLDGITKRIQLGEPIGTSGWNLVGVQNQQAIVYRNGMTRSIDVGQKF